MPVALSGKRSQVIDLLLSCKTLEEVAEKAKVHRNTVAKWLTEDDFRRELRHRQRRAIERALAMASYKAVSAVDRLAKEFDEATTSRERISAANSLLTHLHKLNDAVGLEDEYEELKRKLAGLGIDEHEIETPQPENRSGSPGEGAGEGEGEGGEES